MKFRSAHFVFWCGLWAGPGTLAPAQTIIDAVPEGFEFVRLTNNNMKEGVPSINNKSEVVYSVFLPPNIADIYLFSGGIISRITTDKTYDLAPVINDLSQIAWGTGTNDNDPTFDIVSNYFEGSIQGAHYPSGFIEINNLGDVAWISRPISGGDFNIFLYRHASGSVEQLTFSGHNQPVRLNDLQSLVWVDNTDQVYMYSNGQISLIGNPCNNCVFLDINDLNQVTWTDSFVLWLWDRGISSTIGTGTSASSPRINNNGTITVALWNANVKRWLHSVYKNDVFYRLPDVGMGASHSSINDSDEVAMKYLDLETGSSELYLLRKVRPKGDFDGDCDVDMCDRAIMTNCLTAGGGEVELLADCTQADFDEDHDVDQADEAAFLASLTGPGIKLEECLP